MYEKGTLSKEKALIRLSDRIAQKSRWYYESSVFRLRNA
jgi:hypothetical protein